jgi:pimeloyl-ACP methyl ester carboxylesterase
MAERLTVRTPTLEIAYEASGPSGGLPIILLHGFPDDAHAFDDVAPPLAAAGYRVLAPYLRGYGPTHFIDAATPRMAQQAAIGQDLIEFMDALGVHAAALGGYDWGGRAACIAALLVPERVRALVTIGGYNVQNTPPHCTSAATGTSGTSTPSAGAWASSRTGASCAGCCGRSGHRAGTSRTPRTTSRRRHSTIRTSYRS